ncbi:MAG TPA: alpha/beta fold hydrolase, partial [Nevskiaceae bacterium]|nr:alpha/beta fold hydrolase [Nevskiaceae bacterium]
MRLRRLALLGVLVLAACAPKEILYPLAGQDVPRLHDFPAGFEPPVSAETAREIGGFGGEVDHLSHTPVIFVHGNTVSASFWLPAREHFAAAGYNIGELWAPSYGWSSVRSFDSDDLSVPTLDAFVTELQRYLKIRTGRDVQQFDIVAHSLGVTLVRQWMLQTNSFHRVRNFIGVCGANHGVWTARPDARGINRVSAFELMPGSPWLAQLNRAGETPGPVRYMTLYDGIGWGDELFPKPYQESSALDGARNLAFNREHGTHYTHLELPRQPDTLDAMLDFLRSAHEPLPGAVPP